MPDIIEQLEAGKKIQEEEGIDTDSLRTKISSEDDEEKPKKRGRKKKEKTEEEQNIKEDPFEQVEKIMNETKKEPEEIKDKKPEKYPGFNFHDYYTKGQKVFYVRVHEALGIKEILELKLRTIYDKMVVGSMEKGACQCIGPDSINVKAYKDVNVKEELGNVNLDDSED